MVFSLLQRNRGNVASSLPESRDRRSAVSSAANATVETLEGRCLMSGDSSLFLEYSGRNMLEANVVTGMTLRQTDLGQLRGWTSVFTQDRNPANYSVTINWGDNKTTPGKAIRNPDPRASDPHEPSAYPILIKGTHKYAAPSPANDPYDVQLTIRHVSGAVQTVDAADFYVVNLKNPDGRSGPRTDPPQLPALRPLGNSFVMAYTEAVHGQRTGVSMNNVRLVNVGWAKFNGQENYDPSLWRAQIDWGDGSGWKDGKVVSAASLGKSGPGMFVVGSHTYSKPGTYTTMVNIVGPDGTTFPMESHALPITVTGPVVMPPATMTLQGGVSKGVVKVTGTEGPDKITIRKLTTGALEVILRNSGGTSRRTYSDPSIELIDVTAGGGNDDVRIDPSVSLRTRVDGGKGNDYLRGGSGSDYIYGGEGHDQIFSGPGRGADTLLGGSGNDTIVGIGSGKTAIAGGTGRDIMWVDNTDVQYADGVPEEPGDWVIRVPRYEPAPVVGGRPSLEQNGNALPNPATAPTRWKSYPNNPLFGAAIEVSDVKQGAYGTCGLLAPLAAIAMKNPDLIRQKVVDLGDGTFVVAFTGKDSQPRYVRVTDELPLDIFTGQPETAKFGINGSKWVAIVEKAFHASSPTGYLWGGINPGAAFTAMGCTSVYNIEREDVTPSELIKKARQDLAEGRVAVISTQLSDTPKDVLSKHAYSVVKIFSNSTGTWVTLHNPHREDGPVAHGNPSDGFITISASSFYRSTLGYWSANPNPL